MHALTGGLSRRAAAAMTALIVGLSAAVTILVLGPVPAANAGTHCQKIDPKTGQCTLWVNIPDTHPSTGPTSQPTTGNTGDSGPACYWDGTSQGIKNPPPGPVPCHTADGYWSNTYHCYISPAKPQPPAGDPSWQAHQPGDGAIYNCYQPQTGLAIPVWSANPPAGPGQQLTPQQVAQLAIKQMNMTAINVGLAPTPTEDNPKARSAAYRVSWDLHRAGEMVRQVGEVIENAHEAEAILRYHREFPIPPASHSAASHGLSL